MINKIRKKVPPRSPTLKTSIRYTKVSNKDINYQKHIGSRLKTHPPIKIKKAYILFMVLGMTPFYSTAQDNYLHYHQLINAGKGAIAQEDFNTAQALFDSAFQQFQHPFTKDYVIAAQVAALNKDISQSLVYADLAMKQGYKLECLERLHPLKTKVPEEKWESLRSKKDSIRRAYLAAIDRNLAQTLNIAYQVEQDHKGTSFYKLIVQENFDRIKKLMDSIPFPSERLLGLDDPDLLPKPKGTSSTLDECSAGNSKVIVTLLHFDNPITQIGLPQFIQAIEQGYLHPEEFGSIYTFEYFYISRIHDDPSINTANLPEFQFNLPFSKKASDLERVNLDRVKFGIIPSNIEKDLQEICRKYKIRIQFGYK